ATASAASVAKISRTNGRASCFGFAFLRGRLDWRATARLLSPSAAGPFARGVDFRPETPARITVIQKRPPRAVRHAAATAGGPPERIALQSGPSMRDGRALRVVARGTLRVERR